MKNFKKVALYVGTITLIVLFTYISCGQNWKEVFLTEKTHTSGKFATEEKEVSTLDSGDGLADEYRSYEDFVATQMSLGTEEKIDAICAWIVENLDPREDASLAYAELFVELCEKMDIEAYVVSGTAYSELHSWNYVVLNGTVYWFDINYNDTFETDEWCWIETEILDKTHTWN